MKFELNRITNHRIILLSLVWVGLGAAALWFLLDGTVQAAALNIDTSNGSYIQVDVANRYRARLFTDDTNTDFYLLDIYDRAEDDASPDRVLRERPSIYDGTNTFALEYNNDRKTTVLEATSTRVKLRVEGTYQRTTGEDFQNDDSEPIVFTREYTFTSEGVTVTESADYSTTTLAVGAILYPVSVSFNSDIGTAHSETVLYGDGETEGSESTSGAMGSDEDDYFVIQGTGSYQDIMISPGNLNGEGIRWNSNNRYDQYDVDASSERDDVFMSDSGNQTLYGTDEYSYSILLKDQSDLDTEVEREGLANDLRNPDTVVITSGSEWNGGSRTSGLFFDGTDDYVEVSDASSFDFGTSTDFTIEAWVRLETTASDHVIVDRISQVTGGFSLQFDDSSNVLKAFITSSSNFCTVEGTTDIEDGKWHHVAVVFNRSSSCTTSDIVLYVDGVAESTSVTAATANTDTAIDVGGIEISESSNTLNGALDEVRVWDDARTELEVRDNLYQQIGSGEANLIGYWRFNETDGDTVFDETGNDLDGDLAGSGGACPGAGACPDRVSGFAPDHYDESSGFYLGDSTSSSAISHDLDGATASVSTLVDDATLNAGDTTFTVDSTTGFPSSGVAYIQGDKFSYTGTTATTFTGIPASGDLSVIGHADNSVVSKTLRHTPGYKFRNYRDSNAPTSVRMEGSEITRGTDYNADVKPITNSFWAQDLYMHYPLEDTSVAVGDTSATNSGCTFVDARYGGGVECDVNNADLNIAVSEGTDFEKEVGAVEFWFQPFYDHDDGALHYLFNFNYDNDNRIAGAKHSSNELQLRTSQGGTAVIYRIDGADYSWNAYDWVHLRFEWDDSEGTSTQQRIYVNGVEPTHLDDPDDLDGSAMTNPDTLFIGNLASTGASNEANGIIDEFKVYNSDDGVSQLAYGGNTGESNENLADDSTNHTFSFTAVDSSNRGEYAYFGSDSQFQGLNIDLATSGVGTEGALPVINWEYWNGASWTSLAIQEETAGVATLRSSGALFWTAPGNWFPYSVNGSTDLYYIRGYLASGSYATDPVESTIKTDILTLQYLSNLTNEDQTLTIPGASDPGAIWHFDEGADNTCDGGEDVCDASGNSNDGTFTSVPVWTDIAVGGGSALNFDGTDDAATINASSDVDLFGKTAITICSWLRPHSDGEGNAGEFISKGNSYLRVDTESSGTVEISVLLDLETSNATLNTSETIGLNEWAHICLTWEDDSDDELTLYIDGRNIGVSSDGSGAAVNDSASDLIIAGDSSNNFDGEIDEVKIYPYALTANEIKQNFQASGVVKGASTTFGSSSESENSLTDGLVGWWQMDDNVSGNGQTVVDNSGSGADGTTDDGADDTGMDCTVSGKFGYGCDVDGNDDGIDVGNPTNLQVFDELTLATWINADTVSGNQIFMSKNSDGYYLGLSGNQLRFRSTDLTSDITDSSGTISADTWHHVVVTYDGSYVRLYIDGQFDSEEAGTGTISKTSGSLYLGTFGASLYFDGTMDDTRIYNRALSPVEVRDLYNWSSDPVFYFDYNEGSGQTVYDQTGSNETGELGSTSGSDGNDPTWTQGKFGGGLEFDGSDDYVDDAYTGTSTLNQMSVMAWVYREDGPDGPENVVYGGYNDGGNSPFALTEAAMWFDDGTTRQGASSVTVPVAEWYHLAATYNNGTARMYVDGVLEVTDSSWTGDLEQWSQLCVGGECNSTRSFEGKIDEVKVYDYERTPAQIVEDMNGGHPIGGSPIGSQVGYWKFDEGYGDTANNTIESGTDLDLTGSCPGAGTCPTWSSDGKYAGALSYDGGDDASIVTASDSDVDFNSGEEFSISTWIYPTSMPGVNDYLGLITKWDDSNTLRGYSLSLRNDDSDTTGHIRVSVYDESANQRIDAMSSNDFIAENTWTHVLVTFNGGQAGAANDLQLYINGQWVDGNTNTPAFLGLEDVAADFVVGDWDPDDNDSNNDPFVGRIDELKVYSAELTQDQVLIDYNQGQSSILGVTSISSTGIGDSSYARMYCVPGDSSTCNVPVAHWKLDENTDNTCSATLDSCDSSGNEHHGTNSNMDDEDWVRGRLGAALDFDGSNDFVDVPDDTTLRFDSNTQDFSVFAWVKRNVTSQTEWVVTKMDGDDDGWALRLNSSGVGQFQVNNIDINSSSTIPANEWHYIGATIDRDGNGQFYVNGRADGSTVSISSEAMATTGDVNIGRRHYDSNNSFNGIIDDVRIYDYVRTPAQIAWDYNKGEAVLYLPFDDCSGSTAYDASLDGLVATGNNGTITIGASGTNTSVGTCSSGDTAHAWNNGTTGQFESSLDFDGTDDVVTVTNASQFDFDTGLQNGVSFSTWVYANSDGENDTGEIFDKGTNTFCRTDTQGTTDLDLECSLDLGTTDATLNITDALTTDTWHHIVLIYEDDADDEITIYIDGISRGSSSNGVGAPATGDTNDLLIGGDSSNNFDGQIDDFRIYNYSLYEEQIRTIFTGGAVLFE